MRDERTVIYTIHLTVMLNSELREFCVMKENHVSSLTSDIDINLALPESLKILNWKTQSRPGQQKYDEIFCVVDKVIRHDLKFIFARSVIDIWKNFCSNYLMS